MPPHKNAYLTRIRNETAYPWLRTFVQFIYLFTMVLGVGLVLAGAVIGFYFGHAITGMLPVLGGLLLMALVVIIKEASLMLADIADSITDLNCRYETPTPPLSASRAW